MANPFQTPFQQAYNSMAPLNLKTSPSDEEDSQVSSLSPWGDLSSTAMQAGPLNPATNAAQSAMKTSQSMTGAMDALQNVFAGRSPVSEMMQPVSFKYEPQKSSESEDEVLERLSAQAQKGRIDSSKAVKAWQFLYPEKEVPLSLSDPEELQRMAMRKLATGMQPQMPVAGSRGGGGGGGTSGGGGAVPKYDPFKQIDFWSFIKKKAPMSAGTTGEKRTASEEFILLDEQRKQREAETQSQEEFKKLKGFQYGLGPAGFGLGGSV